MTEHRRFPMAGASPQYGPDKTVDVLHIDLHLTPDFATQTLAGVCTTTVEAIEGGIAELRLDAVDLIVTSVRSGDAELTFHSTSDALVVHFSEPLAAGQRVTFAVSYRTENARRGIYFVGPSEAEPHRLPHVWTQSQDQDARYWFPALDYPHEKQTTSTTVVVPRGLFALANGVLADRRDDGDATIFRYEQHVPHATYLVTMVAGHFAEVEQRAHSGLVLRRARSRSRR